jgi:hypothetical protein
VSDQRDIVPEAGGRALTRMLIVPRAGLRAGRRRLPVITSNQKQETAA